MAIKTSGNTRRGRTRRPRRHAERALSEKEMRLRALVGSDDEIVFEFDRDATYLHVWTTNENLLTQPRDELIGRRAAEIMGEEWASPFVELFRRVLNTGKSETIEYPLELSTGPSFFLARVSPIPSSDGTPKSVCMLVRDITRHKQTEEMLAHRAQEMQALYETSLEINAQRDVPALLRSIVQRAAGLLGVKTGALYLMQPDGACLELVVGHNLPDGFAGTRLRVGERMAGRVAQTREPLIVNNYRTWPGRSPQDEGTPLTGIIQVPMLYGGELIGVLAVEEVGTSPHLFSEQDARLLSLFAGQAAGAVHNARLVTETRRRAERLALLNRIARALNSTLKLDDLLEIVYREITSVMDAEAFFVALYDPTTTELDFRIRVDAGIREPVQRRLLTPGLTSFVVMHKQPLLIRDYECEKDQLPAAKVWGTMGAPQSWLGVPMLMGEKLVGVISVQAYRPNAYAGADQELLSTIADTVAVAIENARLFEETTRRAEQLTTLREIDHAVSSMVDLTSVLEKLLTWLEHVVNNDNAVVMLREGNVLKSAAARGRQQAELSQIQLDISNNPYFRQMVETREPVVIHDLTLHPDWVKRPGVDYVRSWLGVPLFARGEVIGQISLFGEEPGQFKREQGELVMALANHAAIAIANAQLHAQLHEQARCDSLTQALNHGTFIAELRTACEQDGKLALIMLDLDYFKQYNDTYGHMVGDTVLQVTVKAIRTHIKQTDMVGRWGGEEFCVALRKANMDVAQAVAERIQITLAEMKIADLHGNVISPPTVSQGIAAFPETSENVDKLIESADRALYRAKAQGRGGVVQAGDETT